MAMEEARRDLQHRLEEVLGKEHALTLMAALPPTEAATRADINALHQDFENLGAATQANFDEVRKDMREMEARVNERIDVKIGASETRINERIDLKVESSENRVIAAFRKDLVAQTRVFVFSTLTAVVTVGGLAVAAGRVG